MIKKERKNYLAEFPSPLRARVCTSGSADERNSLVNASLEFRLKLRESFLLERRKRPKAEHFLRAGRSKFHLGGEEVESFVFSSVKYLLP